MRPNTPHYVVTVEDSINLGRNFYCRTTLQDHAWGLIHTGVMEATITNTVHRELDPIPRRILDRGIQDYFEVVNGTRSVEG